MSRPAFSSSIAGSLPKPAWLAETHRLWPQWKAAGAELEQAKADASLLWIKHQEDAGLDIVGEGEQSRQHFVHGFLERVEGIDFGNKVRMASATTATRRWSPRWCRPCGSKAGSTQPRRSCSGRTPAASPSSPCPDR